MRDPGTYSSKQTLNKWLIALAVLVSVFSLSGLSTSPLATPSSIQNTWIIRGSKSAVSSVPFSTNQPRLSKQHNAEFAGCSIVNLCRLHTKTCTVELKCCQDRYLIYAYKMLAGVRKTVHQNGKAEPTHALV